ncbi:hypothetical protein I2483_13650 [Sporosarcina sp. E16_3]|uniref:hypothetical protein n=1 Tax=Sporosarcina sp. E16_3 TaxID=2789293 RepID=UPI001A939C1D|nr:hypothetical protein [Sporosarcina sp. E16_3]MBO0602707.1 hypothetical protein [Sporosarcina sp. E16_3]
MPLYTPKFTKPVFKGGKNILASEHLEFIKGGATLDATKFAKKYHEAGLLVARNKTGGKFEDVGALAKVALDAYDNFGILNVDFDNDGTNDVIAGEVIVRGSVYTAKLAAVPNADFKAVTPLIQYISHI